ncbi:hypothetical protein [Streptomyces sp. NPDC050988]|uniref:hypothetical protein n=1 Tax=Streptomyces sp. NPDC050988 TaxID=3365637 RepID=UPI0037A5CEEE
MDGDALVAAQAGHEGREGWILGSAVLPRRQADPTVPVGLGSAGQYEQPYGHLGSVSLLLGRRALQ